nr:hypothetical protein BgiMline_018184 [Biomphalaria glabrata]KAI8748756.1 hypothetical protein BgiMline_018188 [Biomphalaria glabrata]
MLVNKQCRNVALIITGTWYLSSQEREWWPGQQTQNQRQLINRYSSVLKDVLNKTSKPSQRNPIINFIDTSSHQPHPTSRLTSDP